MSILRIKDENGEWYSIPSLKGDSRVHVGEDAPTDNNIDLWIDINKVSAESETETVFVPTNYANELDWVYGSYWHSEASTIKYLDCAGVWRTSDTSYIPVEQKAVYKITGLKGEDTAYEKPNYYGVFIKADGEKSKGFISTSNYIKTGGDGSYLYVRVPENSVNLSLNAEYSEGNDPTLQVKVHKVDNSDFLNMDLSTFQSDVTFADLEAMSLVGEEKEVTTQVGEIVETATMRYKNSKNEFQPVVPVPAGGIRGQVLVKKSDADYDTEWVTQTGVTGNFSKQNYNGLPYWLYTPNNATGDMPLIVVLHSTRGKLVSGLSESENLDFMMTVEDLPRFMYDGRFGDVPAYVIMPQTGNSTQGWAELGEEIADLVNNCITLYGINRDKVSVTGFSMGGTGAFELAYAYPTLFKNVLVVAGGLDGVTNTIKPYNPETKQREEITDSTESERIDDVAAALKPNLNKVWVIVGTSDDEVRPDVGKTIRSKIKNANSLGIANPNTTYTEHLNFVHEQALYTYLINRNKVLDFFAE